ncbi:MAG: protease modulator HflC [Candidatus Omnitrophota bacterium]
MKKLLAPIIVIAISMFLLVVGGALFTISEGQQVVITQFGDPIGDPITTAGLRFKLPFVQQANYFEKRILQWDGYPNQIPTKDKKYIWVDTTARWKIVDALKFLESVGDETNAHARLDDVIDSATRDSVTNHNLVEVVRNTNRLLKEKQDQGVDELEFSGENLEEIRVGRNALTRDILMEASKLMPQYGIELIDVRIKRINYVKEVQARVFERMISERKRAAEKYRSEGRGKRAEIEGQVGKELNQIRSEAYKKAEEIKGDADAEAINIYADAYNKDPEFYSFIKTLDTYRNTIDSDTTVILTTDGDYYRYLKNAGE